MTLSLRWNWLFRGWAFQQHKQLSVVLRNYLVAKFPLFREHHHHIIGLFFALIFWVTLGISCRFFQISLISLSAGLDDGRAKLSGVLRKRLFFSFFPFFADRLFPAIFAKYAKFSPHPSSHPHTQSPIDIFHLFSIWRNFTISHIFPFTLRFIISWFSLFCSFSHFWPFSTIAFLSQFSQINDDDDRLVVQSSIVA